MTAVLLSGHRVRADLEESPIGIYDVIRQDVHRLSTIQPVERIYLERTPSGYRGVLYSKGDPYLFALNGNGFIGKPLDEDSTDVLNFCAKLEESERQRTAEFAAERADGEQQEFNRVMKEHSLQPNADMTAVPEDAPEETLRMHGPLTDDFVERIPNTYRKRMQGAFLRRINEHNESTVVVCGGGVVVKDGKILLVKPTNGYGGYDWTFPKGYPQKRDEGNHALTARREVEEETGYRVFAKRYIGRFTHNDGGACDYYECDVDNSKPIGFPDDETAEIRWVTLLEALELLNDDVDVKILAEVNRLVPAIVIKGGHTGTMIALHLPKQVAKTLVVSDGEPVDSLHITLAYLGKGLSEQQKKRAAAVVRKFASSVSGIKATLGGVGRFSGSESSEGRDVVYLSVDSPQLTELHPYLMELLSDAGLRVANTHGWVPHVTLAYIDKTARSPIERMEPIEVSFDAIALSIAEKRLSVPLKLSEQNQRFLDIGRHNYKALMSRVWTKALPRMSDSDREAANKKVGAKPIGAATKTLGSGGQVRYNYPGEKGGKKKPGQAQSGAPQMAGSPEGMDQENDQLPHPDVPPPQPDQEPIAAEHPDKPDKQDARAPDPTQPQTPKHTVNVQELCSALGVQRDVLMQIVARMQEKFGAQARAKFISFLQTHIAEFAKEHGLDGDYFGLLFDVLTGKVQEGQPASIPPDAKPAKVAKKAGSGV